ncbi:MAG: DUF2249 domain-containing protein [Conexivisphaerales archaeon]
MPVIEFDVRAIPPFQRHQLILERFESLKPGEELIIINDHEPLHLLYFMQHERDDFDPSSYSAEMVEPGKWIARFRKREVSEELPRKDEVIITSFEKLRQYDEKYFRPVPVFSRDDYRVLLVYLKSGQFIPVHTPANDVVLLIVKGRGEVIAGKERAKVFPGSIIVVPGGVRRGLIAETEVEALHLVSPPPSDRDHEEVTKKLAEGKFE